MSARLVRQKLNAELLKMKKLDTLVRSRRCIVCYSILFCFLRQFLKVCHSVPDGPLLLKLGILTNVDVLFLMARSFNLITFWNSELANIVLWPENSNNYARSPVKPMNSRHCLMWHFLVSSRSPCSEQSFPPNWGTGFEQVRVLFCSPAPHVTLQVDQSDHGVYCPSIAEKEEKQNSFLGDNRHHCDYFDWVGDSPGIRGAR